MLVASVSWGNDSVALVQWLYEHGYRDVLCVYCNTGWASDDWPDRVAACRLLASIYGYHTEEIESVGFVPLARLKKGFPRNGMQFCTEELKIKPFTAYLDRIDPNHEVTVCAGIRREESANRAQWSEHVEDSPKHGGRDAWYPLVRVAREERDSLIRRFGLEPLPHRSKECFPCINSNRTDLRRLTPERINEIEELETSMGHTSKGKPRTLFRPYRHGGAVGIREVHKWAMSERGQYEAPSGGCDSGFCGD